MKKIILAIPAVFCMIAMGAVPATAQTFFGFALGSADLKTSTARSRLEARNTATPTTDRHYSDIKIGSSDTALKLTVGYQLNRWLFGLDYIRWGKYTASASVDDDGTGPGMARRPTATIEPITTMGWVGYAYPIGDTLFTIIPRIGHAATRRKTDLDGVRILDHELETVLGLGVEWEYSDNVSIGLTYDKATYTGSIVSLGLRYSLY